MDEELSKTAEALRLLRVNHDRMLDRLKREYGRRDGSLGGLVDLWELIHSIDPAWLDPWKDEDPEGVCTCPYNGHSDVCRLHGDDCEVYENTPAEAERIGWLRLPEHCRGDPGYKYVTHNHREGTFTYHN
jgi:hypothetical protein